MGSVELNDVLSGLLGHQSDVLIMMHDTDEVINDLGTGFAHVAYMFHGSPWVREPPRQHKHYIMPGDVLHVYHESSLERNSHEQWPELGRNSLAHPF